MHLICSIFALNDSTFVHDKFVHWSCSQCEQGSNLSCLVFIVNVSFENDPRRIIPFSLANILKFPLVGVHSDV